MTHIWVPKFKILEGELIRPGAAITGEYTLKKYKVGFKEPVQVIGPFKNLITNWALDNIGPGTLASSYLYLGTGTATPAFSNEQLGTYAARTDLDAPTSVVIEKDTVGPDYWSQTTINRRFNPGAATGTFTEIGFGNGGTVPPTPSPTYKLMSRALIVDTSGNPVSITVLADEYLDASYTVRMYPPLGDSTQTVVLSGTSYTFNTRGLNYPAGTTVNTSTIDSRAGFAGQTKPSVGAAAYTGTDAGTPPALAAITASNMLTVGGGSAGTAESKSYLGSYTVSVGLKWSLTQGNLDYGIRGLVMSQPSSEFMRYATQATITPAIPKDDSKTLTFGFKYSYARY